MHEDDSYIVQDALVLMAAKETIKWMKQKGYLHYIPEFMPLDNRLNILNIDILQSLRFHFFLSISIIDRKEITEEERKLCISFSTPREISQGLKCLWDLIMGTPSSARIIQDVDLVLKALEIVYRENGAAVEGLAGRNGHMRKVVGKGKSSRCGGARTKGEGRECELTKKMLFQSDLLKLCLMKRRNISEFFPDTTVFYD